MREIKFRAWDGSKMHYEGFGITCEGLPTIGYVSHEIDLSKKDSFRMMQFTGLKDKNGKEIYEWDITNLGIVKFQTDLNWDGGGSIHSGFYFDIQKMGGEMSYHDSLDECIVVGNIYENPELVKS